MYIRIIMMFILLFSFGHTKDYKLTTKKELYFPVLMDGITMMMPLRPSEVVSPKNGSKLNGWLHLYFSEGIGVESRRLKIFYENHAKKFMDEVLPLSRKQYLLYLPKDGKYVDVELYSFIGDTYFVKKYRYLQSVDASYMISPSNGSMLDGSTVVLRWKIGSEVTEQYLYAGTSGYGSTDIYSGWVNKKTSLMLSNLPRDGESISVILLSKINGKWQYRYYTYRATDVKVHTQKFVQAYLTNNITNMRKIAPQRVIDKLKTKNTLVKNYFKKIRTYHKLLYFHDYSALVIAKTSDNKEVRFNFAWDGNRWILESVI